MKILAVSYYLPPYLYAQSIVMGRFFHYLAKDNRFQIYMVTADEKSSVLRTDIYADIYDLFKETERVPFRYNRYVDKIEFTLLPLIYATPDIFKHWNKRVLKRIMDKWSKLKCDLIITSSTPQSSHLLGLHLKKYYNCRWVAYFSDPWADNPLYQYKNLTKIANDRLEGEVFASADKLVFTSQETKRLYANKYPGEQNKFFVLEHAYDPDLLQAVPDMGAVSKHLTLRYIGNLSVLRSPEYFFKAIRLMLEENPGLSDIFRFEIIGGHRTTRALIAKHGLSGVVILKPLVDYLESLRLMRQADVLVVMDAFFKENLFLPSKLVEYIGVKKPILGITPPGASMRVIKEAGGWTVEPNKTEKIKQILLEIVGKWKDGILGAYSPPQEILERYKISNKIEEFKKILLN